MTFLPSILFYFICSFYLSINITRGYFQKMKRGKFDFLRKLTTIKPQFSLHYFFNFIYLFIPLLRCHNANLSVTLALPGISFKKRNATIFVSLQQIQEKKRQFLLEFLIYLFMFFIVYSRLETLT